MTYSFHPAAEAEFLFTDFRYPSFTEKCRAVFRSWLLPMTGDVRSIGLAGFNYRLHGDQFCTALQLQTDA